MVEVAACLVLLCGLTLRAQDVPETMNYQGYVSDGGGPLNGAQTLTFTIHSDAASSTLIWGPQVFDGELASGDGHRAQVEFVNGRFNVTLGPEDTAGRRLGDRLAAEEVGGERWIQIKVGTNEPMPRQQLLTAPFAFVAEVARQVQPHNDLLEVNGAVAATQGFQGFGVVPIGSIVPWHKTLAGVPALPDGWVECNGQTLDDDTSPLDGVQIPDLNGQKRFLRGGSTSGTMQADQVGPHTHSFVDWHYLDWYYEHSNDDYEVPSGDGAGGMNDRWATTQPNAGTETRPINMSVVWIMRVK